MTEHRIRTFAVVQNALPPYTMRCLDCGLEWDPKATTDSGLERESRAHAKDCPGWSPGAGESSGGASGG